MSDATQALPLQGTFCWNELLTRDPSAAIDFYKKLFGWTTEEMDMGPGGKYTMFKAGDTHAGGCMQMPPDAGEAPPHWMAYISVDDIDASTSKAESLGAKIYVPPTEIPNIGRFSIISDPTGGTVGLFQGS